MNTLDKTFIIMLRDTIRTLKVDLSWLTSPLSPRQNFCWGILATCCSRIIPSKDNFKWAQNYFTVISELSQVFITYCSKLFNNQRIIADQFPHKISSHSSDDLRKYVCEHKKGKRGGGRGGCIILLYAFIFKVLYFRGFHGFYSKNENCTLK